MGRGQAIFCRRHADLAAYDAVFDQFWRRHVARIAPTALRPDGPRPEQKVREQAAVAPGAEPAFRAPAPPRR
jgi:uncharacterized protein with von Willebrand factor type A (vWA) domain